MRHLAAMSILRAGALGMVAIWTWTVINMFSAMGLEGPYSRYAVGGLCVSFALYYLTTMELRIEGENHSIWRP